MGVVIAVLFAVLAAVTVVRPVRIVPGQAGYVVERLGRYHRTLTHAPPAEAPGLG